MAAVMNTIDFIVQKLFNVAACQPAYSRAEESILHDPLEEAASFGRWWLDSASNSMLLSGVAADFLKTNDGSHENYRTCFLHVFQEDKPSLSDALNECSQAGKTIDCEFRIINELIGMRWLRMVSLPPEGAESHVRRGLLIDISALRQATMRERLSYQSAQFLIANHSLEDSLTQLMQLVCETLGWEWGAYWELEDDHPHEQRLHCKYRWHEPRHALDKFAEESLRTKVAPGEGLIGRVWQSGKSAWSELETGLSNCPRQQGIGKCGLLSGYAFPVAYQMPDGQRHSPGVLEFFSSRGRQREAQLPNISVAIGALVAQTIQRHEQIATIDRLAKVDDLTGLANRSHFHHLLNQACIRATASDATYGLLYIDLDRFKPVNDVFGHEAGNAVLREFAHRLTELIPLGCQIGRLGGDEFAVLSYPAASAGQLSDLADRILAAASRPFMFEGNPLSISASIGISIFPENGATTPELIRCADAAMYRSKHNGRSRHSFSSPAVMAPTSSVKRFPTMEAALHYALLDKQFFLQYQPIFDCFGEKIIAVEALIRWRTPSGELVRPDVFIPVAERSFLIGCIDRWVVQQACMDLALMHRSGFAGLQVNVNMAASEFLNESLPDELSKIAEEAGLCARHLCLELTENMVMHHADKVVPVMQALRKRGFHLSLDDFGTGHSSLSRLNQLPISSLKIDRSFVAGLPENRDCSAIVRTIFDLGHHMNLQIIAEGIETDAQMGFLRQFGSTWMQGFLLGRPMTIDDLIARLSRSAA